ncbi:RNA polymerase sigma factor [Saprospiraceae bacterium]
MNQKKLKIPDAELVRLYIDTQSQEYFSMIYNRYANKVYAKCLSMLKNEEWAIDASQDIFMKIFMKLIVKFEEKSQFSTWVYSITFNYCIDSLRKHKKENEIFAHEKELKDQPYEDDNEAEVFEMEAQKLEKVMDMIPGEDKALLIMKYEQSMSIREISEILDKTESAVKMKIKRAKEKAKILSNMIMNVLVLFLWKIMM